MLTCWKKCSINWNPLFPLWRREWPGNKSTFQGLCSRGGSCLRVRFLSRFPHLEEGVAWKWISFPSGGGSGLGMSLLPIWRREWPGGVSFPGSPIWREWPLPPRVHIWQCIDTRCYGWSKPTSLLPPVKWKKWHSVASCIDWAVLREYLLHSWLYISDINLLAMTHIIYPFEFWWSVCNHQLFP